MARLDAPPLVPQSRGRAGGFSDWLVGPAARRRAISESFVRAFESWGYGFVATPLIEPLETIAAGLGPDRQAQLFRFMDADGEMLALVAERTVSVARVVATQLQRGPFPLRVCYAGPVLRNFGLLGGRRREALQAGCELIGHHGLEADAECIALAADALEQAGVHQVLVDVGHADFVPGLLASTGLDVDAQLGVLAALARRDLVAVEASLETSEIADAERRLLLAFPTLRGGRDILDRAAQGLRDERARDALQELARLWDLLDAYGITDRIHLDLGAVRDWEYYTGPTFEVFSADSGFPLGAGGRYDGLLEHFGIAEPATGFVLHVDRCHDTVSRRDDAATSATLVRVGWTDGAHAQALDVAKRLRAAGVSCRCNLAASAGIVESPSVHADGDIARWDAGDGSREGSVDQAIASLTGAVR